MNSIFYIIVIIGLLGAFNLVLLSLGILIHPKLKKHKASRNLAFILLGSGLAFLIIAADNADWLTIHAWPDLTEIGLSLFTAINLLLFLARSLGRPAPGLWIYFPLVGFLLALLIEGPSLVKHIRMEQIMWVQVAYTGFAISIYARWFRIEKQTSKRKKIFHHSLYIIIGMVVLHVAQILRGLFFDYAWTNQIVPLTGALVMMGFLVYALRQSQALVRFSFPPDPAPDKKYQKTALRDLDQLKSTMINERLFLDPDLDLTSVAEKTGILQNRLSEVLQDYEGKGFYEFLNGFRIQEAKKLLNDPNEVRTSMEAIGLLSGFKTRSGFYKTFKESTGLTPVEFRKVQSSS